MNYADYYRSGTFAAPKTNQVRYSKKAAQYLYGHLGQPWLQANERYIENGFQPTMQFQGGMGGGAKIGRPGMGGWQQYPGQPQGSFIPRIPYGGSGSAPAGRAWAPGGIAVNPSPPQYAVNPGMYPQQPPMQYPAAQDWWRRLQRRPAERLMVNY